jgi:hypothetical protein
MNFTYEHGKETRIDFPLQISKVRLNKVSNNFVVYLCNLDALTNNDKNGTSSLLMCVHGNGKGVKNINVMNRFIVAEV